jgi:hypothetical protein
MNKSQKRSVDQKCNLKGIGTVLYHLNKNLEHKIKIEKHDSHKILDCILFIRKERGMSYGRSTWDFQLCKILLLKSMKNMASVIIDKDRVSGSCVIASLYTKLFCVLKIFQNNNFNSYHRNIICHVPDTHLVTSHKFIYSILLISWRALFLATWTSPKGCLSGF